MAEASSDDSAAVTSIVDLPDNLILHILSLLPSTLDAIEACLVYEKWRNLVQSLPSLHFSLALFPYFNTPSETLRCFTNFINRTLFLRSPSAPILRFRLNFAVVDLQFLSHIHSWIRYAINNGVLDLNIDLFKPDNCGDFFLGRDSRANFLTYFEFPFPILRNSSVRVLKLRLCKMWLPATSQFFSLRSVTLDSVFLTDQMFSHFMLSCASLEDLVLDGIWGIKDVKICSSKLRKLSLQRFYCEEGSLEVVAPNLVSITILSFTVKEYAFEEMVSLVEVKLSVLMDYYSSWSKLVRLLGNVKHLSVGNSWLEFFASKEVPSEGFVLNNLNTLEMHTPYEKSYILGIAALFERCHNLETLRLNHACCSEKESLTEEDKKSISFNVPRLKQVKMNYFRGTNNELLFLMHLEKQAVVLEKIVIVPANWGKVSLDCLEELKLSMDILHV